MQGAQLEKTRKGTTRNSRLLIERFEARIPGFNRFSLAYSYWLEVCEAYKIRVLQRPLRVLHGLAMQGQKHPYIVINSCLTAADKVIAIGHEFAHISDQVLDTSIFLSTGNLWNNDKFDRQAQIVGVVGLMPERLVRGLSSEELRMEFGVSRDIAEFRLSLNI